MFEKIQKNFLKFYTELSDSNRFNTAVEAWPEACNLFSNLTNQRSKQIVIDQ